MPSSNDSDEPITPHRASARQSPNATPIRKASASKNGTPKSAQLARGKTVGKKPEPTLLGDFLLGRPSPSRIRNQRRKSLELLKAEMKKNMVEQLRPPSAVKDRVKQWQKASAGAGAPQKPAYDHDEIVVEVEDSTESEGDDDGPRPGREKSAAAFARARAKSASAPKKRVVSDDHWMANKKEPVKTKANENNKPGKPLPRDFTRTNFMNQPLGSKIEDWVKRTGNDAPPRRQRSKTEGKIPRNSMPAGDGIRVYPSRRNSIDDGIRIRTSDDSLKENRPQKSPKGKLDKDKSGGITYDDGIRVFPSRTNSTIEDDGIRVKAMDESGKGEQNTSNKYHAPRRKSEHYLRPPHTESRKTSGSRKAKTDDESSSWTSGSVRPPKASQKVDGGDRPVDGNVDIPMGSSAFSVLDIPVGAEANNIKRSAPKPKPQRSNSINVPKVFKKVFSEGMKIMQDTVEPQRAGANHPPNIENWLNHTTDPFVDRPPAAPSILTLATNDSKTSSGSDDTELPKSGSRRKRRSGRSGSLEKDDEVFSKEETATTVSSSLNDYMERGIDRTPPSKPVALKRTPATRNPSSPAKSRWTPLKDALESAFRGESVHKAANPNPDPSDFKEKIRSEPLSGSRTIEIPSNKKSGDLGTPFRSPTKRSPPPTTGNHRLSTIASSDALSTVTASTETLSTISESTITQESKSNFTRHRSNKPRSGPKRRLTRHSDLISVLSLPDTARPGRGSSIRSARSVRITRARLETATLDVLMKELAEDEAKYARELKTLVDGVIPVLLTCVLSKSKSAIAAGLFDPTAYGKADSDVTKPIVEMGVALERLKNLHKKIPLKDADMFVNWAYGAHKVYSDYTAAWRMGFQDVVVNLAPNSRRSSPKPDGSELPLNADGDVINGDGERVDVAFLLKRPLVRIKNMARILKGINMHRTTTNVTDVSYRWDELVERTKRRGQEEIARLEDQAANNTDPTRVRDLRTLAPLDDIRIDRTRQVKAKDYFTLSLPHSTGQRMDCRVEVILRDKPADTTDAGDVLFCEVDTVSRWLLFPPIEWGQISARLGDHKSLVVVMVRGASEDWREIFSLTAETDETAQEWIEMLGSSPLPASLLQDDLYSTISYSEVSRVTRDSSPDRERLRRSPSPVGSEIPFGERVRKHSTGSRSRASYSSFDNGRSRPLSTQASSQTSRPADLNEAMERAGELSRSRPAIYHGRHKSESPSALKSYPTGKNDVYDPERTPTRNTFERPRTSDGKQSSGTLESGRRLSSTPSMEMPFIKKKRDITPSSPEIPENSYEYITESEILDGAISEPKPISPTKPAYREDGAPPPPEHRTPSPSLKNNARFDPPARVKRRGSSPLKHEYQPSIASESSSESELSDSASDSYFSESSEEDDLYDDYDDDSIPIPEEPVYKKQAPESTQNLPSMSIGPSNSASQAYRTVPPQPDVQPLKFTATMFSWNPAGRWDKLYPGLCCLVVTPGLIEAYTMNAFDSKETTTGTKTAERPLVAMELTPLVPLRQSNATDIDLRSPPTARSLFKNSQTIMFRSQCVEDCYALYNAIHHSRLHNPTYIALEQARTVNAYGSGAHAQHSAAGRRKGWFGFGRKNSYRASTRAPSMAADSEHSSNSFTSAFSALKRLSGGGGGFNIAKSSVDNSQYVMSGGLGYTDSGSASMYTSSSGSGITPPRTPTASMSGDGSSGNVGLGTNLGSSNLKVRAYRLEMKKWNDLGAARLTITTPPPGMRQASSLYTGPERRIIVVSKHAAKKEAEVQVQAQAQDQDNEFRPTAPEPISIGRSPSNKTLGGDSEKEVTGTSQKTENQPGVILDVVLGSACFSRVGVVGIVVNVWEDITGDDGCVGRAPGVGGVSGRTRKWMLQCGSAMEARWIFGLLGGGAGGVGEKGVDIGARF